jgi:hypothetical protein
MAVSGEHLGGTEGMQEARDAFSAVMDAETPSTSRHAPRKEQEKPRTEINDLFPARAMDRSEESSEEHDPKATHLPDDEPPQRRAPIEGNDDDEEYADEEDQDEEGEEPAEEEEESEEAGPGEIDPNLIVRVMVDGEPVEVSVQEMSRGYIRQETFHRRMGELSEGVKALHAAKLNLDSLHANHIARADALEAYVQAFMPTEPDWAALRQHDPTAAANLRFEWQDFMTKLDGLKRSRQDAENARQAAYIERVKQFAEANRAKLAAAHPEWKNEQRWQRDMESMRRTARSVGYSDAEIAELYDARAFEILLKAAERDRIMATKPKPVRKVPTSGNGVTRQRPNMSRSFDRAEKRLSRSGSVNDAAAVFERILDREG